LPGTGAAGRGSHPFAAASSPRRRTAGPRPRAGHAPALPRRRLRVDAPALPVRAGEGTV